MSESEATNYQSWIAANMPVDPRGQCAAMTLRMAKAFPDLRRVRGHYVCPLEGRRPHWWLVAPSGAVVDPTVEQFASCGVGGDYVEHVGPEPTGQCLNCGALLYGNESSFCNVDCAVACVDWINSGDTR